MVIFALMCLGLAGQVGPEPVTTFGTTVVDTAGFRGTIYYLNRNTGILPDTFKRLKPKGTIFTRSLDITPRHFREGFPGVTKRFEWFAIDYEGNFWIEKAGVYEFALTSDDGSLLYIDDQLLVDNDGLHPPQTRSARVGLDRRTHSIRVSYWKLQGLEKSCAFSVWMSSDRMDLILSNNQSDSMWSIGG
jgi:hypothetical protein